MRVVRLRAWAGGVFAAAVVCSGAAVGTTASAGASVKATAVPAGASPSLKAAGTYSATFPEAEITSELVISYDPGISKISKKEGTFALTDLGDTGNWVISGTTIALLITSTTSDEGTVLAGTLTASGITPGIYGILGSGIATWSATKGLKPTHVHARGASLRSVRHAASVGPAAKAVGTYAEHFFGGFEDTLTVVNDVTELEGTYSEVTAAVAGNWVLLGKQFAMGATSGPDAGLVSIGKLSSAGIGTAAKPGVLALAGAGISTWYATKL
jgi:hypothetical protein